ncbi:DUF1697 domain-containing protein [Luteolibacter pohnpeiensis]|uniref:DUF1697 domain-containing protein n=1 Tax=Luteolibacter pohnpeiensis TaxID=454153 RepID=A0A934S4I7_9BACT|nr:DUF1697 domain-containing protein [Luteolibacter pohnpeiensis]MBK1882386.1 DUF1697 domain-containing protein [Luteolibacter pohnpeiensis]
MAKYIALLRGINVGGKAKLPMKELVTIFKSLGYQHVQTYIQSGNVVFESSSTIGTKEREKIRQAIGSQKGFEPAILAITAKQLRDVIQRNPFPSEGGKDLHVFFLDSAAKSPDLAKMQAIQTASEQFELQEHAFYLFAPDGIGRSKLAASVERLLGVSGTARNWNTVKKLESMLDEESPS